MPTSHPRSAFPSLLLCALLIVVAAHQTCAQTRPAFEVPKSFPVEPQHPLNYDALGLPNFGFVSADLWRGAEPTAAGYALLAGNNVKTIIDLRETDQSAKIPAGIVYKHLGAPGFHADQVDVAAVLQAIADCPKPIFIHCREGRDRTGLAVAAYRLKQKMSADDACRELENFHVNFWWRSLIERRIRKLPH